MFENQNIYSLNISLFYYTILLGKYHGLPKTYNAVLYRPDVIGLSEWIKVFKWLNYISFILLHMAQLLEVGPVTKRCKHNILDGICQVNQHPYDIIYH